MKKTIGILLALIMIFTAVPLTAFSAESDTQAANADCKAIYEQTGKYLSSLGTPNVGSVGGEWMVIDLTRSGYACPDGYYENVVDYVNAEINEKEQLHRVKSTDNSRVILALTSAGYDVTDVDGHNLLMGLTDMDYVTWQGINGPVWALIAFDCHGYEIPINNDAAQQVTREGLINFILESQLEDGGWALGSFGKNSDVDITGMTIQSLAPYYNTDENVKTAVDRALKCLSDKQYDNGGFGSVDGICSESCAQVIVALTALGINPETDERFVKNGVSVLDAMCLFAVEGGGFAHTPNGNLDGMATEQCQYALAAYFRFIEGKTALYDMSDVRIGPDTPDTSDEDAAQAVEALISEIGVVTQDSAEAIEAARTAYDALTDSQKAMVKNYGVLTAAEAEYSKLISENETPNENETPSENKTPSENPEENTPVTNGNTDNGFTPENGGVPEKGEDNSQKVTVSDGENASKKHDIPKTGGYCNAAVCAFVPLFSACVLTALLMKKKKYKKI